MHAYSDRSRCIDHQECPRSRWYAYETPTNGLVNGISPTKINMDLLTGIGFHEGINPLLTGTSVDEAVGRALEGYGDWKGYWPSVREKGLSLDPNEDASYVAYEQASMIEALIRGYDYFVLPQIYERFIVVEAERDESAMFTLPGKHHEFKFVEAYTEEPFELVWGMRGDALLMDKDTLALYILSLKTKKEWKGPRDEETNRHDMQGMSEIATVEQRLGRWHKELEEFKVNPPTFKAAFSKAGIPKWFQERWETGASPTIDAVKMEFALKGRRSEYPSGSSRWVYSNSLIRPWKKSDDLAPARRSKSASNLHTDIPYAFKWNFQDDLGGNHTLGKGWRTVNIWEDMGVKEWMGILWNERVQGFDPGTGIKNQFVLPMEYYRNEEDIDRWKRQILYQERRVYEGRQECYSALGTKYFEEKLDEHFPMHQNYPTDCNYCSFKGICYGPRSYMFDPMASGLFEERTANHKIEESISPLGTSD